MNDADIKLQQQIVEKIEASSSILITVSKDPSVDSLSAALGLTAIVNRLGKHATAIFSGAIPPAITFLDPEKVFENTPDSLRDFIIALSKEKADHLRYKVEGDVVKIFITPYRTTINSEDLEFSQGEYNVELVLALGVESQDNLDTALSAHGRILHDATVVTFSFGKQTSSLGSIDWHDESASSLSEMVFNLGDLVKASAETPLMDEQVATALLTGIVAETDRFSNLQTSSRTMAVAAQLMAAGANQQLIASKLQESHEIGIQPPPTDVPSTNNAQPPANGEAILSENQSIDISGRQSTLPPEPTQPTDNQPPVVPPSTSPIPQTPPSISTDTVPDSGPIATAPQSTLPPESGQTSTVAPLDTTIEPQSSTLAPAYAPEPISTLPDSNSELGKAVSGEPITSEPSLGGTLNATTDQAAEDARNALEDERNRTILKHAYLGDAEPQRAAPMNGVGQASETDKVDIFAQPPTGEPTSASTSQIPLPPPPPLPADPSMLPPPDPIAPPTPPLPTPPPEKLGDILAPDSPPPPAADDPSQFKIPN